MDDNKLYEAIGYQLSKIRKSNQVSIDEMVKHMGKSKSVISRIENGLTTIIIRDIILYLDYFNYDFIDFMKLIEPTTKAYSKANRIT